MNNKIEIIQDLINRIILEKKYTSYLELGIGPNLETIPFIQCEIVDSVDILHITDKFPSFIGTTDEFFLKNNKKYDVIFIDADHEHSSVMKDFYNSVESLKDGGVIIMHDIAPANEIGTSLNAHGTAYKSFIEIRSNPNFDSFTYEFDETPKWPYGLDALGIIKLKPNTDLLEDVISLDYSFYESNKSRILRRKPLNEILKLI